MPGIVPPLDNSNIGAVLVGAISTLVLAANPERRYLILTNDSDSPIYLAIAVAAVLDQGIRLNANGGWYEMLEGQNLHTGAVYAISNAGAKNLCYQEG
jgi:hypothetical protein